MAAQAQPAVKTCRWTYCGFPGLHPEATVCCKCGRVQLQTVGQQSAQLTQPTPTPLQPAAEPTMEEIIAKGIKFSRLLAEAVKSDAEVSDFLTLAKQAAVDIFAAGRGQVTADVANKGDVEAVSGRLENLIEGIRAIPIWTPNTLRDILRQIVVEAVQANPPAPAQPLDIASIKQAFSEAMLTGLQTTVEDAVARREEELLLAAREALAETALRIVGFAAISDVQKDLVHQVRKDYIGGQIDGDPMEALLEARRRLRDANLRFPTLFSAERDQRQQRQRQPAVVNTAEHREIEQIARETELLTELGDAGARPLIEEETAKLTAAQGADRGEVFTTARQRFAAVVQNRRNLGGNL